MNLHPALDQGVMDSRELIRLFEIDRLPGEFHHSDHLRLAFAYLCEYEIFEALPRFCAALKRFAAARGKTQLYNETITCAYFFLIRERMACCEGISWEDFAQRNTDLLTWKNGVLSRYYREETLKSELARRVFVMPDRGLTAREDSPIGCPSLEVTRGER
jgi:hypothetical protein